MKKKQPDQRLIFRRAVWEQNKFKIVLSMKFLKNGRLLPYLGAQIYFFQFSETLINGKKVVRPETNFQESCLGTKQFQNCTFHTFSEKRKMEDFSPTQTTKYIFVDLQRPCFYGTLGPLWHKKTEGRTETFVDVRGEIIKTVFFIRKLKITQHIVRTVVLRPNYFCGTLGPQWCIKKIGENRDNVCFKQLGSGKVKLFYNCPTSIF